MDARDKAPYETRAAKDLDRYRRQVNSSLFALIDDQPSGVVEGVRVFVCTRYDNFRILDREGSFWYANTSSESVDRVHAAQGQGHSIDSQKTPVIKRRLVCFKGLRTTAESCCVFVNVVFVKCRNDFLIIITNRFDIISRPWRRRMAFRLILHIKVVEMLC